MSDEVRQTNASGGAKGDKLARFDQIPAEPMLELAYRYGIGNKKYPAVNGLDNWRNGYDFSLSIAALERHINAFKRGEDNDASYYHEAGLIGEDEDGLYDEDGNLRPGVSHLAAAMWHCCFLMYHLEHNPQFDDRPSTVLARKKAAPDSKLEVYAPSISKEIMELVFGGPTPTPSKQDFIQSGDEDFWKAANDARKAHQDAINAWHNRPQYATMLPTAPYTVEKRRVDGWLARYGIEFISGDLGDTYDVVDQHEFFFRLNRSGNVWKQQSGVLDESAGLD